eukprot:GHVP01066776.1.p1 GENE.GHVP01066776.1~~GHVP01066776.1.p1  ORF type:complete len:145 (+),score=21.99 GHVP01066776.1:770-1204(+)
MIQLWNKKTYRNTMSKIEASIPTSERTMQELQSIQEKVTAMVEKMKQLQGQNKQSYRDMQDQKMTDLKDGERAAADNQLLEKKPRTIQTVTLESNESRYASSYSARSREKKRYLTKAQIIIDGKLLSWILEVKSTLFPKLKFQF